MFLSFFRWWWELQRWIIEDLKLSFGICDIICFVSLPYRHFSKTKQARLLMFCVVIFILSTFYRFVTRAIPAGLDYPIDYHREENDEETHKNQSAKQDQSYDYQVWTKVTPTTSGTLWLGRVYSSPPPRPRRPAGARRGSPYNRLWLLLCDDVVTGHLATLTVLTVLGGHMQYCIDVVLWVGDGESWGVCIV